MALLRGDAFMAACDRKLNLLVRTYQAWPTYAIGRIEVQGSSLHLVTRRTNKGLYYGVPLRCCWEWIHIGILVVMRKPVSVYHHP